MYVLLPKANNAGQKQRDTHPEKIFHLWIKLWDTANMFTLLMTSKRSERFNDPKKQLTKKFTTKLSFHIK